jgi:hypothetical protein
MFVISRSDQPVLFARVFPLGAFDAGGVDEGDVGLLALEEFGEGDDWSLG